MAKVSKIIEISPQGLEQLGSATLIFQLCVFCYKKLLGFYINSILGNYPKKIDQIIDQQFELDQHFNELGIIIARSKSFINWRGTFSLNVQNVSNDLFEITWLSDSSLMDINPVITAKYLKNMMTNGCQYLRLMSTGSPRDTLAIENISLKIMKNLYNIGYIMSPVLKFRQYAKLLPPLEFKFSFISVDETFINDDRECRLCVCRDLVRTCRFSIKITPDKSRIINSTPNMLEICSYMISTILSFFTEEVLVSYPKAQSKVTVLRDEINFIMDKAKGIHLLESYFNESFITNLQCFIIGNSNYYPHHHINLFWMEDGSFKKVHPMILSTFLLHIVQVSLDGIRLLNPAQSLLRQMLARINHWSNDGGTYFPSQMIATHLTNNESSIISSLIKIKRIIEVVTDPCNRYTDIKLEIAELHFDSSVKVERPQVGKYLPTLN